MNNQSFPKIWVIIIIVVIMGGFFTWWQYFRLPGEMTKELREIKEVIKRGTVNWETLQSPRVGFSIKYPPEAYFSTYKDECYEKFLEQFGEPIFANFTDACTTIILLNGRWFNEYSGLVPEINIKSWTKFTEESNFKSLQDFINYEKENYQTNSRISKFQETTVNLDNIQAEKYQFIFSSSAGPTLYDVTYVQHGKRMYQIEGRIDSKYKDNFLLIFNQMLSTFRFLEAEKPYIKVISPNGGEEWVIGETHDIIWTFEGVDEVGINLELMNPDGTFNNSWLIATTTASGGSYSWKIPSDQSLASTYIIVIIGDLDKAPPAGTAQAESNNYFSVVK
ncbi:MAG: hypothetical protein Q8P63_01160 [Candidatus Nealsonbacteria bacterium]|nr:hypothetical protein [Candidatus Nealsonbacteria bacterium]